MRTIESFKVVDLAVSPRNARFGSAPTQERIEAIADNINAVGLIHPMTVEVVDGKPLVVAGQTRMYGMQFLIQDGRQPEDWTTECSVVSSEVAEMVSLSENLQRDPMHPVAEFKAFAKLIESGHSVEAVALAFGTSPLTVERRLKLAAAAPALLESYEATNKPNLEQLMALVLTDDHARQLEVWNARKDGGNWQNTPNALREALSSGTIDASVDRRAKLVPVEVYEAAGGRVQRDLFSQRVYLLDAALFQTLVETAISDTAAEVQAEGWSWVEVIGENARDTLNKLGRTRPGQREATETEAAQLEALRAAWVAARDAYDNADWDDESIDSDALEVAADEAEAAYDAAKEALCEFTAEQKAFGGAAVYLDYEGNLVIDRGLVRREDRTSLDEAARAGRATAVTGGRTTDDAGRNADAMSQALSQELLGHRVVAVQSEVAKNARVAKILLAVWAVEQVTCDHGRWDVPSDLGIGGHYSLRSRLCQLGDTVKERAAAFAEACEQKVKHLPTTAEKAWDVLSEMSDDQLDAIIALGVARSICPDDGHDGLTAKLLEALGFDMADHFHATAQNYTGRVPKKLVIDALREAGQAKDAPALEAMKKGELASTAEERLAGTGWVPKLIRTPAPKQPKPAKAPKSAAKPVKAVAAKATKASKTAPAKPAKGKAKAAGKK